LDAARKNKAAAPSKHGRSLKLGEEEEVLEGRASTWHDQRIDRMRIPLVAEAVAMFVCAIRLTASEAWMRRDPPRMVTVRGLGASTRAISSCVERRN
jgi:hypothetical protein